MRTLIGLLRIRQNTFQNRVHVHVAHHTISSNAGTQYRYRSSALPRPHWPRLPRRRDSGWGLGALEYDHPHVRELSDQALKHFRRETSVRRARRLRSTRCVAARPCGRKGSSTPIPFSGLSHSRPAKYREARLTGVAELLSRRPGQTNGHCTSASPDIELMKARRATLHAYQIRPNSARGRSFSVLAKSRSPLTSCSRLLAHAR